MICSIRCFGVEAASEVCGMISVVRASNQRSAFNYWRLVKLVGGILSAYFRGPAGPFERAGSHNQILALCSFPRQRAFHNIIVTSLRLLSRLAHRILLGTACDCTSANLELANTITGTQQLAAPNSSPASSNQIRKYSPRGSIPRNNELALGAHPTRSRRAIVDDDSYLDDRTAGL